MSWIFEVLATTTAGMAIVIALNLNPNAVVGMVPGTIAMSVGISNRINAKLKEEEIAKARQNSEAKLEEIEVLLKSFLEDK